MNALPCSSIDQDIRDCIGHSFAVSSRLVCRTPANADVDDQFIRARE